MADINKLRVNGTDYDVEDVTARAGLSAIAGKIDKSVQAEKTADMIMPVGIDADGKLWTLPGGNYRWADIRDFVRYGHGEVMFPVGAQFTTSHTAWGDITWDVVGHDIYKNPNDPNAHTMTLLAHYVGKDAIQFDSEEAMYYAASILSAGAYTFKQGSTSYYFTLAHDVPAGGQIAINSTPNAFTVYGSVGSTTSIETGSVSTTSISGATDLGTLGSGELNHWDRITSGSNNYKESAIRQFLNSSKAAGSVWTPQTHFDRPPSWASNKAGFMAGLPADFLAVVGEVDVKCKTNQIYEAPDSTTSVNSTYTVRDKFYLASQKELYGSEDTPADGSVLFPYYDGGTNVDKIKYSMTSHATSAIWWTRAPSWYEAGRGRAVYFSGVLDRNNASSSWGVVPACTIY